MHSLSEDFSTANTAGALVFLGVNKSLILLTNGPWVCANWWGDDPDQKIKIKDELIIESSGLDWMLASWRGGLNSTKICGHSRTL